jgi:hypothetical protein
MHRLKPEFTAEIRNIVGEGNFREGEAVAMIDYGVARENLDAGAVVLPGTTGAEACQNRANWCFPPPGSIASCISAPSSVLRW